MKCLLNLKSSSLQAVLHHTCQQLLFEIFYEVSYPFELEKVTKYNQCNFLLAIIVESSQQNGHADSEVVCCMLTTTIEQWGDSYRVQSPVLQMRHGWHCNRYDKIYANNIVWSFVC